MTESKRLLWLKTACAFLVCSLFLFPVYWMVITSFKPSTEIFGVYPTFFPKRFTLDGYVKQLFTNAITPLPVTLKNSLIISCATTLLATTLATFSSYGLVRFKYKFNKYILFAFLITQMMPTTLFLAPLFITFRNIKLLDTFAAPVIYNCLHSIPFCVITLRPYFLGIPQELEDAATIDGCNKLTAFLRVMVPITYPGIIISAAFTFLWGWGDLIGSLTFIRTEYRFPLTINMYKAIGEFGIEWNMLMSYAVIMTLPVILMMIFLQRYLVKGLSSGAVKG